MTRTFYILFFLMVFQLHGLLAFTAKLSTNASETKYTLPLIPLSDNDITNPDRGFYRWNGNEMAPYPSIDRYARYNWTVFETSEGVYNFTTLNNEAAAAYSDPDGRGTFGLAFRCVVEGVDHAYPAYLDAKMTSWYSTKKKCWMPDWNNPYFIARHDSLVANLGRAFNKDPRIGYIEIRTYGNWGEWHLSGFETPPSPLTGITTATIQHIIDVFVKAFPDKQLIMMSDNVGGFQYAMSKTGLKYPIGWRRDSWCNTGFINVSSASSTAWPIAKDRWKTAPVIIEGYGNTGMTYSLGLQQVIDYHISGIGNGNFGTNANWALMTTEAKDAMMNSSKTAGYRNILRSITYPTIFVPGQTVRFKAEWSNVGVAPVYRDWKIMYRLCNKTNGTIVWETKSKLNLRTLLPTYNFATLVDLPIIVDENFVLASSIPSGNYDLEMFIADTTNYFSPLKLAIQNRKPNGAYLLGNIVIDSQNAVNDINELTDISIDTLVRKTLYLNVQLEGKYSLNIYKINGKCVYSNNIKMLTYGRQSIDLMGIENGMYILKVMRDNKQRIFKFVKN